MGFVERRMDEGESQLCWTYDLVEERLVEAAALWRRSPGDGKWPFAADAPWHQMKRINETKDGFLFHDARGCDLTSSDVPLRPLPPTREEIGRRDEASAWLERYLDREIDRRVIALALDAKAYGHRPDWAWIMRRVGIERGRDGVRMRYERAVGRITKALTKARIAVREARLS